MLRTDSTQTSSPFSVTVRCTSSSLTRRQISNRFTPANTEASSSETISTSLRHEGHRLRMVPSGRLTITIWCVSMVVTVLFFTNVLSQTCSVGLFELHHTGWHSAQTSFQRGGE